MKRRRVIAGSPEELRAKAARCAAKALQWLRRGEAFEKAARREERKRDKFERLTWPEQFCATCIAKKSCLIHPAQDQANARPVPNGCAE